VFGSGIGWVSWVMAVAAAAVWWLGVIRDHQKDDQKYLQGNLQMVRKLSRWLDGVMQRLMALTGQPHPSDPACCLRRHR
jgi:hypothetical protein